MKGAAEQSTPMVSVIICSIDPSKFERISVMYRRLLDGGPFEIIGIHDARGMAEGYNRGISQSSGSILIFSHDDVEFLASDFRSRVVGHMSQFDVLGVLGTVRLTGAQWWNGSGMPYVYGQMAYPGKSGEGFDVLVWSVPTRAVGSIQAMDGMFLCATRPAAETLRFGEQTFQGFHLYDLDFTFRAHLAGLRCGVANDLFIIHESTGTHDEIWKADAQTFLDKFSTWLAPPLRRHFRNSATRVADREGIVRVMSPSHWTK